MGLTFNTGQIIARGAYADIFRVPNESIVYKLFVSGTHPTNTSHGLTRVEDDVRRHNTFQSECAAYAIASRHPYLRDHVPGFHGTVVVGDVQDGIGHSVGQQYVLDHCYAMDFIAGDALKSGGLDDTYQHLRTAWQAFREAGIRYVRDASVFAPHDPERFKVIDFATEEFEAYWDMIKF